MQREKGVLSKPCVGCGTELVAQTNPDGSTAYASCSKCYPAQKAAEAPAEKPVEPKPAPPKELAKFQADRVAGTVVIEEDQ